MRIIGTLNKPNLNITVFKMENKISVKFEIGPFEQWYKFLQTERLSNFEDVEKILTDEYIKSVFSIFDQMNAQYIKTGELIKV